MILYSTPASPFGRKVKIAAILIGLDGEMEIRSANVNDAGDPLMTNNPLGKIPTLVLDDGTALFDSKVIVEYLDSHAGGGKVVPAEPTARFQALRLQALCDGLLDAALLQVYEGRYRPEERRHQAWIDRQADKVSRALSYLEADPPPVDGMPHVGQIGLACALGYLDFRFDGTWRATHPALVSWLANVEATVPALEKTRPHD